MKIGIDCHILEAYRTGAARYLINLLKHWANENHEFILYFKNRIPEDIPIGLRPTSRKLKTNSDALFMHFFLPRAAKKDKVDILFCPGYIAPIFYRNNIALALHDIIYEARPDLYNWPSIFDKILLKKVSKISAKKAKIIFTCSEFSKNEIIKYYKVNSKKIFVIPLAADEKFIRQPANVGRATSNIKKKYGVKDKFIFYVGALIDRRFISEMIEAFKFLEKTYPELVKGYKFLIGGKNYTDQKIEGKEIVHVNYIDEKDLPLLYNAADLFIWLSSYEGFGLPPLEAMACGTPVVTTKMSSLPEAVGDSALFVKNPEDINQISEAIHKGLTDKNLRKKLIKKGLEQAKKFSWQKTAEETLRIINHE